jgi:poly-gamma-glutamate synthesis protein (capsule biosynthesis protein)
MKIAYVGDIAFFGKYSLENPRIYEYLKPLADELKQYDYVIGNLETPFRVDEKPFGSKSAYVSAAVENIDLLIYLNVTAVSLANNHMCDFGQQAVDRTISLLEEKGIGWFGLGNKQFLLEQGDNCVAFSGYCCYSTNPVGMELGLNVLDVSDVERQIATNSDNGYTSVVCAHFGQEHVNQPNYDHIRMARKIANKDYTLVGHHPHVLQGIETHNNSLLAYSLGNFCFDDVYTDASAAPLIKQNENNKSGMILEVEYNKSKIIGHATTSFFLNEDHVDMRVASIDRNIARYSEYLELDKLGYSEKRNQILTQYIAGRKQSRNLNWVLKRLRIRYILILVNGYLNSKKYKKHILANL